MDMWGRASVLFTGFLPGFVVGVVAVLVEARKRSLEGEIEEQLHRLTCSVLTILEHMGVNLDDKKQE